MMRLLVRYILPATAVALFAVALFHVFGSRAAKSDIGPTRLAPPPESPYELTVAGAGLIEPQSESISIGGSMPGLVEEVAVQVGDQVAAGDLLFRLDERQQQSQLAIQQALLDAARAELVRLKSQPRPEEIPVTAAQVQEAQALANERRRELQRIGNLSNRGAATQAELDAAQAASDVAQATLEKAKAQLALLKAGAWQPEIAVAEAAVARAEAEVRQIQTQLRLLRVTAPIDGQVLQVHVRPGQFVATPSTAPLLIMGQTATLHVRVDIDEQDIPRYLHGAPATAKLRGDSEQSFPLTFVRVEPYVIPKRSLTGENTERIDTRVLQVIYEIDPQGEDLYVGQQVDVYFDVDTAVLSIE